MSVIETQSGLMEALSDEMTPKFLATRSADGIPNVVPVTSIMPAGDVDDRLIFGNFLLHKSVGNLDSDPRVGILVITTDLEGWVLQGDFVGWQRTGAYVDCLNNTYLLRYNAYTGIRNAGIIQVREALRHFCISKLRVLADYLLARAAARPVTPPGPPEAGGSSFLPEEATTMPLPVREKSDSKSNYLFWEQRMKTRRATFLLTVLLLLSTCAVACKPSSTATPTPPHTRTHTDTHTPTHLPPPPTPTPMLYTPTPTPVLYTPTPTPTPFPKSRADWTSYTNSNQVTGLAFDQDGYLWAATIGGVVRWNLADGSYTKYLVEDGLVDHYVTSVAIAPDGTMWFGTRDGVSHFDGETWTAHTRADGYWNTSIAVAPDGVVWIGTLREGVSRFDGEAWTTYTTDDGLVSPDIRSIAVAPDGALWFGTCALWSPTGDTPGCFGVSRFDGETWTTYTEEDGLAYNRVNAIAVASDGALWFGTGPMGYTIEGEIATSDTSGGVSRFDGQTWTTYTRDDGLVDNWVNSIGVAPDGALWFGTEGGVSRFDGEHWDTYTTADGLVDDNVTSIAVAPDGTLCFGTGEGVSCFDGETWATYTTDGPAANLVPAIAVAPDGTVWAGIGEPRFGCPWGPSGQGILRFNGETWITYTEEDGLADDIVLAIAVEPDGTMWAATGDPDEEPTGVSLFDGQTWTTYTIDDGLTNNHVRCIAVAPDGAVWFGTWGGGVSRYDGETWTAYLGGKTVNSIAAAPDGTLWFGTCTGTGTSQRYKYDVARFDGEDWRTYSVDNEVIAIAVGPDGVLWVGTSGGVSRLDGETWTTYTTADGLVDDNVRAIGVAPDGVLWFGAGDGVSRFDGETWTTYTKEDGLASYVQSIAVGPDGAIWFGTFGGISRYLPPD